MAYGTVIVDLETHRPIDLLPDRKVGTVAGWLKDHPSVEVVARDRSKEYAQAIAAGAPNAIQVVDRWHLLKNLRQTLERVLDSHRKVITEIAKGAGGTVRLPRSRKENEAMEAARQRRHALYARVLEAFSSSGTIQGTAKKLGVSRHLVRQAIKLGDKPERALRKRQFVPLDAFEPVLLERWAAGCREHRALLLELRALGFEGHPATVERWTQRQRLAEETGPTSPGRPGTGFSTRELVWLLLREDEKLGDAERRRLEALERGLPALREARALALRFAGAMRERKPEDYDAWLVDARSSLLSAVREFVVGLEREAKAVRAAFGLEWSNGPVEGAVNKIKVVKREMYGRASFEFLRRRVLLAA